MKKILVIFIFTHVFFTSFANANFNEGKAIFEQKCQSCHQEYISISKIKENFFEKDNKLLNLNSPSLNMIAYAINKGPKAFTIDDSELNQEALADFLQEYLKKPNLAQSICDENIIKYYKAKKPMNINYDEAMSLAAFFLDYEKFNNNHDEKSQKMLINETEVLYKAKKENKKILLFITSDTCHYCKVMKQNVLSKTNVKKQIDKNFIFVEVVVEDVEIPFNAQKYYPKITPTFIFLDKFANFKNSVPGSWDEKDFLSLLDENK